MYLLDDNVISEVRKGDRCDPKVAAWYASVPLDDLFLDFLGVAGEVAVEASQAALRWWMTAGKWRGTRRARARACYYWAMTISISRRPPAILRRRDGGARKGVG